MTRTQAQLPSAGDPYLPDSGDDGWSARHYDLALSYRPEGNRLDGQATITAVARRDLDRVAFDLSGLAVSKVSVDGARSKRFTQRKDKLLVTLDKARPAGTEFRVAIAYAGRPRPMRTAWGEVGWEELTEGALVAGQPNGAPSWFPCNDHPADKATYRIAVTTDAPFTVVANGTLAERRRGAGTVTWVYDQPEPMASYLATVQIGRYEIREIARNGVTVQLVRPPRLGGAAAIDFGRQEAMLTRFGQWFGPYPFAGYAVVITDDPLEIPLEAQGVAVFGSNHVDGLRTHERLVAHELAHQWFGNSLTVARWSDIWLNEGFACYAEWLWSEASDGPSAQTHAERQTRRLRAQPQDLVLAEPGAELMFDDRVYKRGALTLHALRRHVGDDAFFALVRDWVDEHRHGLVTTADFLEHVERGAGAAARDVLTAWLYRPRLP